MSRKQCALHFIIAKDPQWIKSIRKDNIFANKSVQGKNIARYCGSNCHCTLCIHKKLWSVRFRNDNGLKNAQVKYQPLHSKHNTFSSHVHFFCNLSTSIITNKPKRLLTNAKECKIPCVCGLCVSLDVYSTCRAEK